jgi:hypothetical protein
VIGDTSLCDSDKSPIRQLSHFGYLTRICWRSRRRAESVLSFGPDPSQRYDLSSGKRRALTAIERAFLRLKGVNANSLVSETTLPVARNVCDDQDHGPFGLHRAQLGESRPMLEGKLNCTS